MKAFKTKSQHPTLVLILRFCTLDVAVMAVSLSAYFMARLWALRPGHRRVRNAALLRTQAACARRRGLHAVMMMMTMFVALGREQWQLPCYTPGRTMGRRSMISSDHSKHHMEPNPNEPMIVRVAQFPQFIHLWSMDSSSGSSLFILFSFGHS